MDGKPLPHQKFTRALTTERKDELREAFKMFDRDGNGTIDKDELMLCLNAMGHYLSIEELDALMATIDSDGNGTIDFDEFCTIMADKMENGEEAEKELAELKSTFQLFDSDGSGRLDHSELQRAFKILGIALSEEESRYLVEQIDTDGDGDVSFEEFMEYLINFKETHD